MKTPEPLAQAYLKGWGHCHGYGKREDNPFTIGQTKLSEYWNKGFDDCEGGVIDGPTALGQDYIEPQPK